MKNTARDTIIRSRRRTLGLDEDEQAQLLEIQHGRCGVCDREIVPETSRISVDNAHIRGLLCVHCTGILRIFREDIGMMEKAIEFLRHPPAASLGYVVKRPTPRPRGFADPRHRAAHAYHQSAREKAQRALDAAR